MFMNGNLYEERGEDRRIRKSKKALQEALIRLLSKKSIGEITIKELTDEADVHRGTFYHHYADAMDLKVKRTVVTPSGTRYVPEYVSHFLLSARSDVVGVEMVVIFSPTLLPFSDAMRVASCAVSCAFAAAV